MELIGATLIVANRSPRLGAWLIALFLVPVTIVVHGVAMAGHWTAATDMATCSLICRFNVQSTTSLTSTVKR